MSRNGSEDRTAKLRRKYYGPDLDNPPAYVSGTWLSTGNVDIDPSTDVSPRVSVLTSTPSIETGTSRAGTVSLSHALCTDMASNEAGAGVPFHVSPYAAETVVPLHTALTGADVVSINIAGAGASPHMAMTGAPSHTVLASAGEASRNMAAGASDTPSDTAVCPSSIGVNTPAPPILLEKLWTEAPSHTALTGAPSHTTLTRASAALSNMAAGAGDASNDTVTHPGSIGVNTPAPPILMERSTVAGVGDALNDTLAWTGGAITYGVDEGAIAHGIDEGG